MHSQRALVPVAVLVLAVGAPAACKAPKDDSKGPPSAAPSTQAPAPPLTPEPAPAPKPEGSWIEAPITHLLSEYKDNEVRADNQFKAKLVETSGTVGDIKKDITGRTYVTVGTGAVLEIPVVQCFVRPDQDSAAANLSKGQKVTVRGKVDGLMMNVLVSDCVLNPMQDLCDRLATTLGNGKCFQNPETGDWNGLEFVGEQGGALVMCVGSRGERTADDVYKAGVERYAAEGEKEYFAGSARARCFTLLHGKAPVPDGRKAQVKAFFDTL